MEALMVKVLIVAGLSLFAIIEMAIVNLRSDNALSKITPAIAMEEQKVASI